MSRTGRHIKTSIICDGVKITPRRAKFLDLLVEGMSNEEMASQLNVTTVTVKSMLYRLYEEVDIRGGKSQRSRLGMWWARQWHVINDGRKMRDLTAENRELTRKLAIKENAIRVLKKERDAALLELERNEVRKTKALWAKDIVERFHSLNQ